MEIETTQQNVSIMVLVMELFLVAPISPFFDGAIFLIKGISESVQHENTNDDYFEYKTL
jgi:hypothetical protein